MTNRYGALSELYQLRANAGVPEYLNDAIVEQERRYLSAQEDVLRACDAVRGVVDRVERQANAGEHLNELGELQSRSFEFDRKVVLYEIAASSVRQMVYLAAQEARTHERKVTEFVSVLTIGD